MRARLSHGVRGHRRACKRMFSRHGRVQPAAPVHRATWRSEARGAHIVAISQQPAVACNIRRIAIVRSVTWHAPTEHGEGMELAVADARPPLVRLTVA